MRVVAIKMYFACLHFKIGQICVFWLFFSPCKMNPSLPSVCSLLLYSFSFPVFYPSLPFPPVSFHFPSCVFMYLVLFGNRRWQKPFLLWLKWILIWRWRRSKFKPRPSSSSVGMYVCMYVCMYKSIYNAPLSQPKQSRVHLGFLYLGNLKDQHKKKTWQY